MSTNKVNLDNRLKLRRNRSYIAKDFDEFKSELLRYAKTYFPDKIQDFSEAGLGGLLLDMAAFVGDSTSFYTDHQFNELDYANAVEPANIQRHIERAGVQITGPSPAVATIDVYIDVPADPNDVSQPTTSALPKLLEGASLESLTGVPFTLLEDIDFAETHPETGILLANVKVINGSNGVPVTYRLNKSGICISGTVVTENFDIPAINVPFRKIILSNTDVTEVVSIVDSNGNEYYEVDALTQDTVFTTLPNLDDDRNLVADNLQLIPAPRRYIKKYDLLTGLVIVQFGAGDAKSLDDDIITDPSDLSIPLYGKKKFTKFSIDPNSLLKSRTLGISPYDTTLTINYRYGGGLNHNVSSQSIRTINEADLQFPTNVSSSDAESVRNSIDVINVKKASGGEEQPTLDELRSQIPVARQAQGRIVTKQDLISRIYTMPSNFGKVFRVGIRQNPKNPLAALIHVISRDEDGQLTQTPDTLKKNLRTYINQFRLVSDALDIMDTNVINFGIRFEVLSQPRSNKSLVLQTVLNNIIDILTIKNFQIDQPIVIDDINSAIINSPDVISLLNLEIINKSGLIEDLEYSETNYNLEQNTYRNMIFGPEGSIFELKYPDIDIVGAVR